MGKIILVEGEPGTGKSRAIKNLNPETTIIVQPNNKDLPFKGGRTMYNEKKGNVIKTKSFIDLRQILKAVNEGSKFKTIIIEDLTHYFSKRVIKESALKSFDKWLILAADAYKGLLEIEDDLREDLYIIIIGHTQISEDSSGNRIINLQTPGKMLERSIKIPSYVTYVLHTDVQELDGKTQYKFLTNKDGSGREAKSPEECLDLLEDNDYQLIIDKIEKYQQK